MWTLVELRGGRSVRPEPGRPHQARVYLRSGDGAVARAAIRRGVDRRRRVSAPRTLGGRAAASFRAGHRNHRRRRCDAERGHIVGARGAFVRRALRRASRQRCVGVAAAKKLSKRFLRHRRTRHRVRGRTVAHAARRRPTRRRRAIKPNQIVLCRLSGHRRGWCSVRQHGRCGQINQWRVRIPFGCGRLRVRRRPREWRAAG